MNNLESDTTWHETLHQQVSGLIIFLNVLMSYLIICSLTRAIFAPYHDIKMVFWDEHHYQIKIYVTPDLNTSRMPLSYVLDACGIL